MPLNLPSAYPGNPSGYVTYYKAQADNYSMAAVYARNPLETTTVLDWEMSSMLANCSRSIATKVYVADTGAWSTASNWFPTGVPAAGDNVLIGEGVSVTYDIDAPTTSLSFVRLDGTLAHPNNASTAMNVNTIFITPTGKHQIASEASPLSASRTCKIIFSSTTDMNPAVDTALQTKGIVSAGTRQYFGASKTFRLKVASNAGPAAGATLITLEAQPSGWAVGDRITICGTQYKNSATGRHEEVRTITGLGLSGTVSLNTALTYGHTAPSSTLVTPNTLRAYVANLSRNIKFSTENGTTCLRHRRAHDMQMHYPTYRAQWVEWLDMGRTDKGYAQGAVWTVPDSTPRGGTAAGIIPCNGPTAVGGVVTFDTPSRIRIQNFRAPDQNFTIYGTQESGTATTEVIFAGSGITGQVFFKTVTGWSTPTATIASIDKNSVSRLMTSSGVRNTNGSTMSTNWTYSTPTVASNVQGRYPVHFHKCGIEGDVFTTPIQMLGCVVSATPGWGYAHHLSHVNFVKCIAHDFSGAGFVAEAGNETGLWRECHSTRGGGHGDLTFKDGFDTNNFDPGRNTAYWFTGRLVKVVDCVATDAQGGFIYNVRFQQTRLTLNQTDHPRSLYGAPNPSIDEAPIVHFDGNESIAMHIGFFVIKAFQLQNHDIRTVISNHKSWSCVRALGVEYTQHYTYRNVIGVRGTVDFNNYEQQGFNMGANTSDQVWVNPKFDGFEVGMHFNHNTAGGEFVNAPENGFILVNPQIINYTTLYSDYQSTLDVTIGSEISLTSTASLSLSLTTDGTRRWTPYATYRYLDSPLNGTFNGWRLIGEARDSVYGQVPSGLNTYPKGLAGGGQRDVPYMVGGSGIFSWDYEFIRKYGLFQDSVLGYTMHMPAYFSDRITGVLDMKMVPATMPNATYAVTQGWAPLYVRGTADYTKTEAPAIQNHRVSTAQNVNTNVNLFQGSTHSLSISMYVAGVDRPLNCHVVDNNNGTITIVPPLSYTGTETFSYWIADNNANVTRGTVIVEVNQTGGGTGRAGVNDFIATQYNTATSVNVLANDIGDSKALQTVTVVGGNAVGTASISTGGIIVFTPTSTYAVTVTQTAEIQYTFTASGGSSGASLFVTVNAAPATGVSGTPDFAATPYNTPVALNLLANDVGDNKVAMTATVVGGQTVGTVTFNVAGQYTFTPTSTFASAVTQTATVNYTFTASGGSSGAAWLITVNPPPATGRSAVADFNSTTYNVAVSTNVLANDTGDNKVLQTAVVVGGAAVGTASISTGGIIVFTPTSTFANATTQTAEVQYTFTASGGSAGASLFITVNPPPPTGRAGVSDFNSTTYNVAVSTNVLANDIGDSKALLTATVVGGLAVGTASISTGGIIVFTPTSTFARTITQVAEIQYTFTASGGSAGASLFVTVNAGPPLPVAVADFTSTTYNLAVSTNVLANDTGGTVKTVLTATVIGGNSVGTASISTGGVIVFTPSTTFATTLTQVAEIQYTFTTTGGSAAGSLFITVNAGPSQPAPPTAPTAPIATNGTAQAFVGRQNGIIVLRQAYDTNPEGFIQLVAASRIDGVTGTVDFDPSGILYVIPDAEGTMRINYRVRNGADLSAEAEYSIRCANPPRVGGGDSGSGAMIGAPVSWSRKSVSNIRSVAKSISAVFADLDPNDPIRLAERMVRKYSFAEVKKLIGTSDFESLLDMELQELVEEMERMKNGG
jgi:hypothetical protein